jgi:hypothetical protein
MPGSSDDFRFKPAKSRPGAYFNDGHTTYWVQHDGTVPDASPLLIKAVNAARKAFLETYNGSPKENANAKV